MEMELPEPVELGFALGLGLGLAFAPILFGAALLDYGSIEIATRYAVASGVGLPILGIWMGVVLSIVERIIN